MNKLCDIDTSSSAWYEVQGPMRGSFAADTIDHICQTPTKIRDLLIRMGYCNDSALKVSNGYAGLTSYHPGIGVYCNFLIENFIDLSSDKLADIAKKYIKGAMCGTSAWGLFQNFKNTAGLYAIDFIVKYDEENDGMVALSSCDVGAGNIECKALKRK
jgi:hypothetical protein